MEQVGISVSEIRRHLALWEFPIVRELEIAIYSPEERRSVISQLQSLWRDMSSRINTPELLALQEDMIELEISTHNSAEVELIHKVRSDDTLLLNLRFHLTYHCNSLSYQSALSQALTRWSCSSRSRHKNSYILAAVLFAPQEDNPLLRHYEGHNEVPFAVLSEHIDFRQACLRLMFDE